MSSNLYAFYGFWGPSLARQASSPPLPGRRAHETQTPNTAPKRRAHDRPRSELTIGTGGQTGRFWYAFPFMSDFSVHCGMSKFG